VEEFAKKLSDFFVDQWNTRMPAGVGASDMVFLVAGYDEKQPYGRVFEIQIPSTPAPVEKFAAGVFGPLFGGQGEITARLLNGIDLPGTALIKQELMLDDQKVKELSAKIGESSGARIPYQFLPLQDCIDLSILLVRTTAQLMEYQTSVRGVGGQIDVATITRQEGFRYVQRKEIRVRLSDPESTALGCALSTDWVRAVGNTVVYPALFGEKAGDKSCHPLRRDDRANDFNRPR
jgi:hypothetical protein